MLQQTKRVVDKLNKTSLKRSEFKCRVQRDYIGRNPANGKAMYEYGNVNIFIRKSGSIQLIQELVEQGFEVIVYRLNGTLSTWLDVKNNQKAKLTIRDCEQYADKWIEEWAS